ncbi:unnamed protein product [Adineta steineri]|uniref:Uncharacterized protein n=1 Tax=Adineta steineri TaxID=433720 RepID=A0A819G2L1_9BILA|nr:unnamed protein product [Adineta steineri]CAF1362904.1 unnamed protein product [Adineta steineri]CAF1389294.1 unnamed protein product [Adineta steineri]CAF3816829.1 unnamed protein product [Adineta steineri]CAF3877532.1 unnamed protein product [Adineta steineri]
MLFIKITFLFLYSISNLCLITCLLCTNCTDIVLSFNNHEQLPKECQDKFIEANACQVSFRMNYITKEIHLDFTHGDDPKRNYQLNLSVLDKFDEPKNVNGNITYICKTENKCATLFY